jgi:hypothetical protein
VCTIIASRCLCSVLERCGLVRTSAFAGVSFAVIVIRMMEATERARGVKALDEAMVLEAHG